FSNHEKHWPVINALWQFNKLNRVKMHRDVDFCGRVEAIYNQISDEIARYIPVNFDNLRLKLAKLNAERSVDPGISSKDSLRRPAWRYLKGIISFEIRNWFSSARFP